MVTKTWTDPIVEEVREARDEIARETGYDPKRLSEHLKESQKQNAGRLVKRSPQLLAR